MDTIKGMTEWQIEGAIADVLSCLQGARRELAYAQAERNSENVRYWRKDIEVELGNLARLKAMRVPMWNDLLR